MAYYTNLFSPETYEAFTNSDRGISGFRTRQQKQANRIKPGDKFICYMTKTSRWIGVLEIVSGPSVDETPIFYPENDPFVVRFQVKPLSWLPIEKTVPIHEDDIWDNLSFTQGLAKNSTQWTGKVRGSLTQLDDADGAFLERKLLEQAEGGSEYPIDMEAYKKFLTLRVRRADKDVSVTVPEDADEPEVSPEVPDVRESIKVQTILAEVGSRMGMQIWIPRADRGRVLAEWGDDHPPLLERLPLNYDETTLKTIEQIDVLWLKGRAIKRAFEVEHTTSVYSGILRMADLLALQPNMDIRLHIVAPVARREKVFQELLRPVFSLLERGPLSDICTYISYDSVRELAAHDHLAYLSDSVLEEYEESAEG